MMIRIFVLLVLAAAPLVHAAPAWDTAPLDEVAIQQGGRKKPLYVFAQDITRTITGKTTVAGDGRSESAMEFVTGFWLAPGAWLDRPVILVNHRPLKVETGLDPARKFFSYRELAQADRFTALLSEAAEVRKRNGKPKGLVKEASDVGMRMAELEGLAKGSSFTVVPCVAPNLNVWLTVPQAVAIGANPELAASWNTLVSAAAQGTPPPLGEFASILHKMHETAADVDFRRIEVETFYQKLHPLRWAWILYAAAAIVAGLTAWRGRKAGYIGAWILAGAGFLLQILGLVCRSYVAGRPPVTNMYESVVWVAFGTVLFALIFEAIYRCRTYLYGALPVAVVALILADTQPLILDRSINPLMPVLRDNFWLTTHVLSITLSYAAFALALGVGHVILGKVIVGGKPTPAIYNYLYRILQVGVLLLAVGTILGAVWANYSWGRFWDWDPKETWALIALLGYLIVLHGRIAGVWGGFGLAVGSVLGFLSILMAWYGVNFVLGAGLHSYGFGSGGFPVVAAFCGLDIAFVAVAIFRYRFLKAKSASPVAGASKVGATA